ncbi:hypothetical protein GOP47_0000677 [Adiantum capillus-veneris]|uniref:Uncharacterized protein n=1 Tax=Adiantum capillus-veneris TaxID=13818 RepID=A0A9D4VDZ7_ADICA|nr:hypothetical protein GOP47_0000677 [Adiantum capillus-veneris]
MTKPEHGTVLILLMLNMALLVAFMQVEGAFARSRQGLLPVKGLRLQVASKEDSNDDFILLASLNEKVYQSRSTKVGKEEGTSIRTKRRDLEVERDEAVYQLDYNSPKTHPPKNN